jgi:hypothetical protein
MAYVMRIDWALLQPKMIVDSQDKNSVFVLIQQDIIINNDEMTILFYFVVVVNLRQQTRMLFLQRTHAEPVLLSAGPLGRL